MKTLPGYDAVFISNSLPMFRNIFCLHLQCSSSSATLQAKATSFSDMRVTNW